MTATTESQLAFLALRHSGLPWSFVREDTGTGPQIRVSSAFTELTGLSAEELRCDPIKALVGSHSDPGAAAEAMRLRRSGRPGVVELRARRSDGTLFWNRMVFSPVEDGLGTAWFVLHRDITEDRRRAREHAALVDSHDLAKRRTSLLIEAFERLANARRVSGAFAVATAALVPETAEWAGIFRTGAEGDVHPEFSTSDRHGIAADLAPRVAAALRKSAGKPCSDGSLIVVPVRAFSSSSRVLATWSGEPGSPAPEDVEVTTLLGARLGLVIEQLTDVLSERARTETIESAVFAPPVSFPGVEIAAQAAAPRSTDAYAAWCDAYPLPGGGAGFVISRVYAVDAAGVETAATSRSAIRAFLSRDPSAENALLESTRFAYAMTPDPFPSGGQIASVVPRGNSVVYEVATVAHLPLVVRVPGEGLRLIEGKHTADLGPGLVPMTVARGTLPRGSVFGFLSDSLLSGRSTFGMNGLHRLLPRWADLPHGAPAVEYAEIIEGEIAKMRWRRRPCFLVARLD